MICAHLLHKAKIVLCTNTVYTNYTQTRNICPGLSNYLNQAKACGKI